VQHPVLRPVVLREALADRLLTSIEVRTDREQNLALHRRVQEAVLDALITSDSAWVRMLQLCPALSSEFDITMNQPPRILASCTVGAAPVP